jgi:ElaB/YqjD/DUF883 family membrane-anchored ribosome-binding protein
MNTEPISSDPGVIRAQIAETRSNLSGTIDELGDKVNPGRMARRQGARIRRAGRGMRERIMGSSNAARDAVSEGMSSVGGAISEAPEAVRSQTQGSPMAAGLVAFGVGMVLSALLPPSQKEAQGAAALKEQAQPLVQQATDAAREVAGNLKEPLQEAAAEVKATASDAVDTVASEGKSATDEVKHHAEQSTSTVRQQASDA